MKLLKLEVYTTSDRDQTKNIILNQDMILSAALHPHEDKPELVLADFIVDQIPTSFFLTQNGVKSILEIKTFIKLPVWQNTEKLKKVAVVVNPKFLAYMTITNGYEMVYMSDKSPMVLTEEAIKEIEKHV